MQVDVRRVWLVADLPIAEVPAVTRVQGDRFRAEVGKLSADQGRMLIRPGNVTPNCHAKVWLKSLDLMFQSRSRHERELLTLKRAGWSAHRFRGSRQLPGGDHTAAISAGRMVVLESMRTFFERDLAFDARAAIWRVTAWG